MIQLPNTTYDDLIRISNAFVEALRKNNKVAIDKLTRYKRITLILYIILTCIICIICPATIIVCLINKYGIFAILNSIIIIFTLLILLILIIRRDLNKVIDIVNDIYSPFNFLNDYDYYDILGDSKCNLEFFISSIFTLDTIYNIKNSDKIKNSYNHIDDISYTCEGNSKTSIDVNININNVKYDTITFYCDQDDITEFIQGTKLNFSYIDNHTIDIINDMSKYINENN